jgi:Tol biopolymer transport system component
MPAASRAWRPELPGHHAAAAPKKAGMQRRAGRSVAMIFLIALSVFAPGVISGPAHEASPAFTPDGQTVYFSRQNANVQIILESHKTSTGWSEPAIAPFSGVWNDLEPAMSPDGSYLIFISNRPAQEGGAPLDGAWGGKVYKGNGGNLWRVDRTKNGWSEAKRLPDVVNGSTSTFAPAIAGDGSIYFMRPGPKEKFVLYRSQKTPDGFEPPKALSFSDPEYSHVDPAVAPDESFLVFASTRPPAKDMDLFIVKKVNGQWGEPKYLAELSAKGSDTELRLSPDLNTVYFSSDRLAMPRDTPRTRADSEKAMKAFAWDNGLYNIWEADLRPYRL